MQLFRVNCLVEVSVVVCCLFVKEVLAQTRCSQLCWTVQRMTQVLTGMRRNSSNEAECKDLCANDGTCIGVDYNSNQASPSGYGCWFIVTPNGELHNNSDVNHWSLVNCTDECLPYCWRPVQVDSHVLGGTLLGNNYAENLCKLKCSQTPNCTAVDWETIDPNGCYFLFSGNATATPSPNVHHWSITRNFPTTCPASSAPTTTASGPFGGSSTVSSASATNIGSSHDSCDRSVNDKVSIVLGVLFGVSVLIIIGLVINTFRILRNPSKDNSSPKPNEVYAGFTVRTRLNLLEQ